MRQTKVQYTNVPIQLMGGRAGPAGIGEVLTQHQRPQNKFVPMQLRTQPSNLSAGQLQRVNTTILEPRSECWGGGGGGRGGGFLGNLAGLSVCRVGRISACLCVGWVESLCVGWVESLIVCRVGRISACV